MLDIFLCDQKRLITSLTAWVLLLASYAFSLSHHFYVRQFDYIIYITQLGFDIVIFVFAYVAFKNRSSDCDRTFYLLLFLSILPGLFANESYNFLINILNIQHINSHVALVWSVGYTLFLLLQICAWLYLLKVKLSCSESVPSSWLSSLPYVQSALVILLSLASIMFVRQTILHDIGSLGTTNSFLETIQYGILLFCLSRTKNKSLIMIEFGFLILMAFNLAHRFSYLSGQNNKLFNVLWMLSLIVISYGFILSSKSNHERIEFFIRNSIHVISCSILIVIVNVVLLTFIGFDLMISMIEMKKINGLDIILINTPAVLVFLHSIILFALKKLTEYLSKPFENLVTEIDRLDSNTPSFQLPKSNNLRIYEIERFNAFIVKTINELQSANKVKSDFLMNMSHDFRTPASGIYNMARSMFKRLDNFTLKKQMRLIVDSSDMLLRSLDDILDYSRLDNGQYIPDQEEIDIKSIVNDIIAILLPKAVDKGIKLESKHNITNILPVKRRMLIHRVLLNITSNAVKFTHSGSVTVTSSTYDTDGKKWLTVGVKDTGIGIDETHYHSIFEPFNRIQPSNLSSDGGIGLGLNNVKALLQSIGGRVEVISRVGHGSLFTVFIPLT